MLIAFVHSGRSFMPEADAYTNYFSSRNISCVVTTPEKINDIERDLEWFFWRRQNKTAKEFCKNS
jgi:hypothetical protein